MRKIIIAIFILGITHLSNAQSLPSLGSYVWNANDEAKTFNYKLQLSFVRSNDGFPQYGTVLAGGGYYTSQDGGVFQIYFPYSPIYGGVAPKIRLGKYNNQGWSDWETFFTTANANNSKADWTAQNLTLDGTIRLNSSTSKIEWNGHTLQLGNYVNSIPVVQIRGSDSYNPRLDIMNAGNSQTMIKLNAGGDSYINGGKVGIGTDNPQTLLAVNGTITSKEVKVTLDGWSDFVFKNDYKLKNLNEVETFITENKHLPNVPTEKEVKENGVNLGEMNKILLEKVEELTLYMIEQNKRIENLEKENKDIRNKLKYQEQN